MTSSVIKKLNDHNIQNFGTDETPLFRASDIGTLLEIKKITKTLESINNTNKQKLFGQVSKNNKISREQWFITVNGLYEILSLSRKHKCIEIRNLLEINKYEYAPSSKEACFINKIIKSFQNEKISLQYPVDLYRIDLYFNDYNIAVEFDEKNHNYYIEKDNSRMQYIIDKLGCKFIRCKETDDIFESINKIYVEIKRLF